MLLLIISIYYKDLFFVWSKMMRNSKKLEEKKKKKNLDDELQSKYWYYSKDLIGLFFVWSKMMRYSKRLEENILKNLDDKLQSKYDFVNSLEWANKKSELDENNRYWTRNILYTKKPRNKINYVLNSNTKGIARVLYQILRTKNSWSHVNFPLMSGRPVTMIVQGYPFSQNI